MEHPLDFVGIAALLDRAKLERWPLPLVTEAIMGLPTAERDYLLELLLGLMFERLRSRPPH